MSFSVKRTFDQSSTLASISNNLMQNANRIGSTNITGAVRNNILLFDAARQEWTWNIGDDNVGGISSKVTGKNRICIGHGVEGNQDDSIFFPTDLISSVAGTDTNFSEANGGRLFPVSSSLRFKQNVRNISDLIKTDNLYNLRPVTFNPKEGHGNPEELHLGIIAEEAVQYFPELVPLDQHGLPASFKYSTFSVVLLEEMKKLKTRIDTIESYQKNSASKGGDI